MLSTMRKRIRVIMIVVAVAFIAGFLGGELWNMIRTRRDRGDQANAGLVGKVGARSVSIDEYRNAVAYMTQKYREDNQLRDLTVEDYAHIEDQAWGFIVSELTWNRLLEQARVRTSEEELFEIMKGNPPEELRDNPELLDEDGQFSQEKYLQVMNNPANQQYFQRYFTQLADALPKEKLRIDVLNSFRLTRPEIEAALAEENSHWKVTSLYFGPRALSEKIEPTEPQVETYWREHQDEFQAREVRKFKYVVFPVAPTPQDSSDARDLIDRAYRQLESGESFNMTMLDFTDLIPDTTSALVGRGLLDPDTDSVVGTIRPGSHSAPFLADYGWQMVLLDSLRGDSLALRRILVRIKLGTDNVADVLDRVRDFIERCRSAPFDSVAADAGLVPAPTRPMVAGEINLAALQLSAPVRFEQWGRKAEPGDVIQGPIRGAGGYYLFTLEELVPGGLQTLEEARQQVVIRARRELEKEAWRSMATTAVGELQRGVSFEKHAAGHPEVELATEEFSGLADARRRRGPELAGALLGLDTGQRAGPIETGWGVFVLRCDERTVADGLTAEQYAERRQQQLAQELMTRLLEEPDVKDFRDPYSY